MYERTIKSACLAVICGLAALWNAAPAQAGLAVSPLKQEISLRPGEPGKLTLTLSNRARRENDPAQSAMLSVVDVVALEAGQLEFKNPGSQKTSAAHWIALSQAETNTDPGKSQTIDVTITPPPQTPSGEYYAAILVTLGSHSKNQDGVDVTYQVASGIFVNVLGQTLTKQAKITQCEFQCPQAAPAPVSTQPADTAAPLVRPPQIAVILKNTGRSRFDATGKIRIVDQATGRVAMTAVLTSLRPCVFAGDSRLFQAAVTKPLPAGKYTVKVDMDYQSTWSHAYATETLEITPAQAELLAALKKRQTLDTPAITLTPSKIASLIPAGGSRSLSIALKSCTDVRVRCLVSAASTGDTDIDSWITVGPQDFTLAQSGYKAVEIKVQVPPDAKAGAHSALIAVESWPEGSDVHRFEIPIEIQVKAEK